MGVLTVRAIRTFPEHGGAAVDHDSVDVAEAGLTGDRRRKAAVSLIGDDSPATRANFVLDGPTAQVEALDGRVLRIGDVILAVTTTGSHCAGLYGSVGESGTVRIGDVVEVMGGGG